MIWVCRAGKSAQYFDEYIENTIISLPWDGFENDLSNFHSLSDFKDLVKAEKGDAHRTSISNWATQIHAFCVEMKIGDYVLIPTYKSQKYALATITGDYKYSENIRGLRHLREIEIIKKDIPRDVFSQSIQYSLGAFRTIFKPKGEEEILNSIKRYNSGV